MNSETALIAAAQRGSVAAFTELVARHRIGLLRFLVTRTAGFADAEDALQDTLINAFRYIKSYDARWRFSTWLYRIAINNAANMRATETEAIDDLCNEESGPLEQCIAASERENLWISARRSLNDEVYTAMWLRYAEDMSVNDIAAVLGRSVSWTKVNLLRARQQLDGAMAGTKNAEVSKSYG